MKGKNILVTGGAGLLGTSITQHLTSLGNSVQSTFFSRRPTEHLKKYYKQYDFTKYDECLAATKGLGLCHYLCGTSFRRGGRKTESYINDPY